MNKWKAQSHASDTDLYIENDSLLKVIPQVDNKIIYPITKGSRTECEELGSHIELTNKFIIDRIDDSTKAQMSHIYRVLSIINRSEWSTFSYFKHVLCLGYCGNWQ